MSVAGALHNRRRFEPATTAIVTRRMSRTHDPYRAGLCRRTFARVGIGASCSTIRVPSRTSIGRCLHHVPKRHTPC